MTLTVRPSAILRSFPSTLPGIELENAWNQFIVRKPDIRSVVYRPTSGPKTQAVAGEPRHSLLPSIHYRAGMGHRVSSWISAFIVAQDHGLTLLRLPWKDQWDSWLGLDAEPLWVPGGEKIKLLPPVARENDTQGEKLFARIIAATYSIPVTYRLAQDHFTRDQSGAFEELATRYWERHDRTTGPNVRISVHVRRGDVTPDVNQRRFRGLDYFRCQAVAVTALLDELHVPWEGVVHTQGTEAEMRDLVDVGFRLSNANSEFEDFHRMCCSDVLIASPSSFSVTAGMISGGLVMRPREWFHTMPSAQRWVAVEEDDTFDPGALRRAVAAIPHPSTFPHPSAHDDRNG